MFHFSTIVDLCNKHLNNFLFQESECLAGLPRGIDYYYSNYYKYYKKEI